MTDRRLTRRRALQLMGVATAAPFSRAWAAADERPLTFLAVGDWGRDGAYHQAEVAAQMGMTADKIGARFIISVGDNFYEEGVASVDDPKWKTSFQDVYAAPSLQKPWYAALGNHDYYGDAQAQVDFTAKDPSRRWRMPARTQSFSEVSPDVSLDVFMLDTTPLVTDYYVHPQMAAKLAGQDPAAQIAWLEQELAASKADWKIVIGHHPIWSGDNSQAGKEGHWGSSELVANVDPILQRHGVALYLNGHDHQLQHTLHGATHYVCTGAGSKLEDACDIKAAADFCALDSGFVACAVTRGAIEVGYRDWQGQELRVVSIARPT